MTAVPTRPPPLPRASAPQTVRRALEVLECFRAATQLRVSDIARHLGLPTSTVHRLLRSLMDAGFVDQDPDTARYRLGTAFAEFASLSYRHHRIYLAEPHLERLAAETGASASIAVRDRNDAVLLATSRWREEEGQHLQGLRIPLHASALGKVLLSWSPPGGPRVEHLDLYPTTSRTLTSVDALRAELDETRRRGYALNDEELDEGFRTIGAPILDASGRARFALGLRGPVKAMQRRRLPRFARLTLACAKEIEDVLLVSEGHQ